MNTLDTNNNGYIDYTEFLAGCMRSKIYLKEDHLRSAFEYFDIDQSGTITVEELKKVLSNDEMGIPEREIEELIREVDKDNDNQIDYNEFLEMMKKDLKI
jgi:calcium-dependent protein kinase